MLVHTVPIFLPLQLPNRRRASKRVVRLDLGHQFGPAVPRSVLSRSTVDPVEICVNVNSQTVASFLYLSSLETGSISPHVPRATDSFLPQGNYPLALPGSNEPGRNRQKASRLEQK